MSFAANLQRLLQRWRFCVPLCEVPGEAEGEGGGRRAGDGRRAARADPGGVLARPGALGERRAAWRASFGPPGRENL